MIREVSQLIIDNGYYQGCLYTLENTCVQPDSPAFSEIEILVQQKVGAVAIDSTVCLKRCSARGYSIEHWIGLTINGENYSVLYQQSGGAVTLKIERVPYLADTAYPALASVVPNDPSSPIDVRRVCDRIKRIYMDRLR